MMKDKLVAGLFAASVSAALMGPLGTSAQAGCFDTGTCPHMMISKKKLVKKPFVAKQDSVSRTHKPRKIATRTLSSKRLSSQSALAVAAPRARGPVVAMIKAQAPRHGVPVWFALRIAQIESSYNPRARGAAGEIGVYQLKCATARGLGFRGSCNALYNAATNIQYGLKHLGIAIRTSRGNLKLAASKHNGGLGRKTLVRKYVSRVF